MPGGAGPATGSQGTLPGHVAVQVDQVHQPLVAFERRKPPLGRGGGRAGAWPKYDLAEGSHAVGVVLVRHEVFHVKEEEGGVLHRTQLGPPRCHRPVIRPLRTEPGETTNNNGSHVDFVGGNPPLLQVSTDGAQTLYLHKVERMRGCTQAARRQHTTWSMISESVPGVQSPSLAWRQGFNLTSCSDVHES